MDFDVPEPERLQAGLVELMRAGDNYRVAYRAAFEYRGDLDLPELRVPALVTAADPAHRTGFRIRDCRKRRFA